MRRRLQMSPKLSIMLFMRITSILILALVGTAAAFDLRTGKIPNKLIMVGYVLGLLLNLSEPADILKSVISALWPIAIWYPLFLLRVFGAGDIKLFSALSVFFQIESMLFLMFLSLIFGALMAPAGLMNIPFISVKCEDSKLHRIHFAPAIAAATFVTIIREVII